MSSNILAEIQLLSEKKKTVVRQPPASLYLQLKSIQQFPDNQAVALYFCPAIKKYFSFVYGKEGIILEDSLIKRLGSIEDVDSFVFNDGSLMNIDKKCAEHILCIYEEIEDKEGFENFILESDKNFLAALEYSVKNQELTDG